MEEPPRPPISVILPVQQESQPVIPSEPRKIPRWIAIPILILLAGAALVAVASDQGWWPFATTGDESALPFLSPTPTASESLTPVPVASAPVTGNCGAWNYDNAFYPLTGTAPSAADVAAFACITDAILLDACVSVTSTYSGSSGSGTYSAKPSGAECSTTMRDSDNKGSTCYWNAQQLAQAQAGFDAIPDVKPEEKMSVFLLTNAIGSQPGWTCTSDAPCPRCEAF